MVSWILEKIDVIHVGGSLRAGSAALGRIRGVPKHPPINRGASTSMSCASPRVDDGTVQAVRPLPFAGLLTLEDTNVASLQREDVKRATRAGGCSLAAPVGMFSFLALPIIPILRPATTRRSWAPAKRAALPRSVSPAW
jgi:hypothetical protein